MLSTALLALMALFIEAPLQPAANIAEVPNPVKSAWFLLWTQELVSYSKYMIYLIIGLGGLFFSLPYLAPAEVKGARWLPRAQWPVTLLTIAVFLGIVGLTLVAIFCRGENWAFVFPF